MQVTAEARSPGSGGSGALTTVDPDVSPPRSPSHPQSVRGVDKRAEPAAGTLKRARRPAPRLGAPGRRHWGAGDPGRASSLAAAAMATPGGCGEGEEGRGRRPARNEAPPPGRASRRGPAPTRGSTLDEARVVSPVIPRQLWRSGWFHQCLASCI